MAAKSPKNGKVAIVTGGNTGIGLAICELLLSGHNNLHICLACRNQRKAEAAQTALQTSHPDAVISIIILDISNIQSVYKAAKDIRTQFHHVDYLYFNAGIMPVSGLDFGAFIKGLFSSNCAHMLTTGTGLLYCLDDTTPEGLKQVFATNLFGHFVLTKELETCIGGSSPTQIIWTSSSAAARENFDITDIQHANGVEPYKSSKFAVDLLSVELNARLNKRLRLFVPSLNYSTYNGCESLIWLSKQNPECLDPQSKFCSSTSIFGNSYVQPKPMSLDVDEALKLYEQLDELERTFSNKYKKAEKSS